ncbi:unnamed protein product, partial [Iphiclides podalirius]
MVRNNSSRRWDLYRTHKLLVARMVAACAGHRLGLASAKFVEEFAPRQGHGSTRFRQWLGWWQFALDTARWQLSRAAAKHNSATTVQHGSGSGNLRWRLRAFRHKSVESSDRPGGNLC